MDRFRPVDRQPCDSSWAGPELVWYFCRLVPEKGVHLLIERCPECLMTQNFCSTCSRLDPGSYAASLLERAERLGYENRIVTTMYPTP